MLHSETAVTMSGFATPAKRGKAFEPEFALRKRRRGSFEYIIANVIRYDNRVVHPMHWRGV
jgi:hypothetical protein